LPRWALGLLGCGGVIGLLLVAILVVAIVSNPSSKTSSGTQANQEQGEDKKKSTKAKSEPNSVEVGVGETAQLRDRSLVVTDVERNFMPPNRFTRIEPGNEMVRVAITLENTGDQSFSYNTHDFKMQDSNGVQKNTETIMELPNRVDFGDLAPGGTLQGNIIFQVPQGDNNLALVYETDIFSKQTITVRL